VATDSTLQRRSERMQAIASADILPLNLGERENPVYLYSDALSPWIDDMPGGDSDVAACYISVRHGDKTAHGV
jgi:hypothetical protein